MPGLSIQHCSPATAHPQRHKGLSVFAARRTEARPDPFPSSPGPSFWPLLLATHRDHPPPISQLYRSQCWTWKDGINGPNKWTDTGAGNSIPLMLKKKEKSTNFLREFSTEICSDKTFWWCSQQCNRLQSSAVTIWSFKLWIAVFLGSIYGDFIEISFNWFHCSLWQSFITQISLQWADINFLNQTSMWCAYLSNIIHLFCLVLVKCWVTTIQFISNFYTLDRRERGQFHEYKSYKVMEKVYSFTVEVLLVKLSFASNYCLCT